MISSSNEECVFPVAHRRLPMLDIEERFMIKELYRKGVSISDIARQTGRDRKTIRKLVHAPLLSAPKPRQPKPCKLDPYVAYLEQRMEEGVFNARIMRDKLRKVNPVRNLAIGCLTHVCSIPCKKTLSKRSLAKDSDATVCQRF
jgi:hypothetical protein